jgi:hypothetical protein
MIVTPTNEAGHPLGPRSCKAGVSLRSLREFLYDRHLEAEESRDLAEHVAICSDCEQRVYFLSRTDPLLTSSDKDEFVRALIDGTTIRVVQENQRAKVAAAELQASLGVVGELATEEQIRTMRTKLVDDIVASLGWRDPKAAAEYILSDIQKLRQQSTAEQKQATNKYLWLYTNLDREVKRHVERTLFLSAEEHNFKFELGANELFCLTVFYASLPDAAKAERSPITVSQEGVVVNVHQLLALAGV